MHKQTDVITQQFGRGKEHNVVNIVCWQTTWDGTASKCEFQREQTLVSTEDAGMTAATIDFRQQTCAHLLAADVSLRQTTAYLLLSSHTQKVYLNITSANNHAAWLCISDL